MNCLKSIDVFNLCDRDICLEHIITALPNICRYAGCAPSFYSVAQHSIELANYLISIDRKDLAQIAILHDGCEAYIGDIIYPIKQHFQEFLKLEKDITELIFTKFHIYWDNNLFKEFNYYDKNIVVNEMKCLNIYDAYKYDVSVINLNEIPDLNIDPLDDISLVRRLFRQSLLDLSIL